MKKSLIITHLTSIIKNCFTLSFFLWAQTLLSFSLPLAHEIFDSPISIQIIQQNKPQSKPKKEKPWTFIVYISADNDLRGFAPRNIKQMAAIGSNKNINILVHLDIRISGNMKITRRYYIKKNKLVHVNADDPSSQKMDSGAPETLISCCRWAATDYPAKNYALILWNHGSGIVDPMRGKIFNVSELFTFNPLTNKLELDRSVGYLDLINAKNIPCRGICWDDSSGHFLTNQDLDYALNAIYTDILKGKKLNIIGFDACLMSMLEIGNIIKKYADVMVGSQEVIYGMGWHYTKLLYPFSTHSLDTKTFAQHIVNVYEQTYGKITDDYTLSAVDLSAINEIEENVNLVAQLLLSSFKMQKNESVRHILRISKNKLLCTHFDEPSYLDLHHLYNNIETNLKHLKLTDQKQEQLIKQELIQALSHGRNLIKKIVFANTAGKTLSKAMGLSIYFPERKLHSSYYKTNFAHTNAWIDLIARYHNS